MFDRGFNQFLEVLRRRFISNERVGHVPPPAHGLLRTCAKLQGLFLQIAGENTEIIMLN